MRVAVINLKTGLVENVAQVEDGDGSAPEDGFQFVPSDSAAIGDSWDGTNIIPAPQPVVEESLQPALGVALAQPAELAGAPTLQEQIDALSARLAVLEAKSQ